MNPTGTKTLRFKNVTEVQFSWQLKSGATTTTPKLVSACSDNWMAPSGTNEGQEAVFDSYVSKKLVRYTWKLSNFRVFIQTTTTQPAVGTAPPVTDVQVTEMPEWVFWYYRLQTMINADKPPANTDEGRYTKFCKSNCHSKIWGSTPIPYRRMDWYAGTYANAFQTTTGKYLKLEAWMNAFGAMNYNYPSGVDGMPTPDIYLLPDDPYPSSAFNTTGVTRVVDIWVLADLHSYSTWKLLKPVTK